VGLRVVRLGIEGRTVFHSRSIEITFFVECEAEIVVNFRVLRLGAERFAELSDRTFEITFAVKRVAAVVIGVCVLLNRGWDSARQTHFHPTARLTF
jgi:hypothetical protein